MLQGWRFSAVSSPSTQIVIDLDSSSKRDYPIYISSGLLKDQSVFETHVSSSKRVLIVSNEKVGPLYSPTIRHTLEQLDKEVHEIFLPDGEEFKTMESCMRVLDRALDIPLDRKSLMIALGGGVVGDLTGFAASIYQRGIPFLQIPTSLMAMVDSSVGGKTGVNHRSAGKNLIGSFHQPSAVFISTDCLLSLPQREYLSGIAETIKYGLINDFVFFEWLEDHVEELLVREEGAVREMIVRAVKNKAEIVTADEREEIGEKAGGRALLNLGHTFGHAIETGLGYGEWLHGEAVAVGMMMAADLSCRLGLIDLQLVKRLESLLSRFSLPVDLLSNPLSPGRGQLTAERFLELMRRDKKVMNGQLHLILLRQYETEEEGRRACHSVITSDYSQPALLQTLQRFCSDQD